jgi:Bacteriocin-protection, YdeI or OmpD-Associated/Domain of unknown function (DUF1905)
MRFRAVLQTNSKTATGIEVPDDVVTALGSGKRPKILVTIRNYTYRTTVGVVSGRSMIPVSADVRAQAGVIAGDDLTVDVELDDQPRVVEVPADLAAALDADPRARQAFDALSYSHQRAHVLAVEGAKKPETRQRRVERAVADLSR